MSSTSGFVGSFIGPPHAGGGVGGVDSPGAPGSIAELSVLEVTAARVSGFALQNGTPTIVAALNAVPADANPHLVSVYVSAIVTSAETGGAVTATITDIASGKSSTTTVQPGGSAAGLINGTVAQAVVGGGGATVSVQQSSALTAGAASVNVKVLVD